MKKALIIAYFFPPLGGSGVQRTLKFVKYMPKYQIQPIVSTVKSGHNFAHDESLLDEVPTVAKVYRSSGLETLWVRDIIERLTKLRANKAEATYSGIKTSQVNKAETKTETTVSLKQRLFNFIDNYFFIPDSKVRWLLFGFLKSLQVARKEEVDYLFSSSYPYTVHLIALLVKKFYNKPWIADFRDPWVGNLALQKNMRFRKQLDAWLERKVIKNADCVINVTSPITETYKERYPEYAYKMVTIPNGFDLDDFKDIQPIAQDKFTVIYTGIINDVHYDIQTFAQAVTKFLDKEPTNRLRFQCLFIGYIPESVINIFIKYQIRDILVVLPYMNHKACLNYLGGAHVQFLTFNENFANAYSGKLFDYIGSGKPILGLLPKGIASDLIEERKIGHAIMLGDVDSFTEALNTYYQAWERGENLEQNSTKRCADFSRESLTKQLIAQFLRQS